MTRPQLSILISGAGVAGLTLALSLVRQKSHSTDLCITLVERSPDPRTTGQAIDIRGPAVDVIHRLNLEPQIKARHTTETGMVFINESGRIFARLDATGDSKHQAVTSEYEILRGELVELLLEGVNQAKETGFNIKIVPGETIATIENLDSGVNVTFTHGKLPNQTFDAVVAADGSTSRTRSMIFEPEELPQPVKQTGMYVAFLTIPRVDQDDKLAHWCTLPGGLAMQLRPHRNDKTMGLYLTITNSISANDPELDAVLQQGVQAQKDYLRSRFQGSGWQSERFLAALDGADDFYMTHWCSVKTPVWHKGRCAIIGDTAFATMGIGTSLAMVSGYILAGELSKVNSVADVSTSVAEYERIMRGLVKQHEWSMSGIPQLMSPQSVFGVKTLRFCLWTMSTLRIPQLAMRYFGSSDGNKGWTLPEYDMVL